MDKFEELLLDVKTIRPLGDWDWRNRKSLISKYVDPHGEVWTIGTGESTGPCGCKLEVGWNSQRNWFYCPVHKENGILVITLATNQVYWLVAEEK